MSGQRDIMNETINPTKETQMVQGEGEGGRGREGEGVGEVGGGKKGEGEMDDINVYCS